MVKSKFTKGKWHHDLGTASIWHPNLIGHRLACVDYYGLEMSEEDLANALLISKAPEMLEMLEMHIYALDNGMLDFYKKYGFNISELSGKVRELIKEATEI